jgi:hypothetical protein
MQLLDGDRRAIAIFNALIAKSRFMRLLTDLRESRVNWTIFEARGEIVHSAKKTIMPHQRDALADVRKDLAAAGHRPRSAPCRTGIRR